MARSMKPARNVIGGLGNLMFKQAYLWSQMREGKIPDVYVQSEKYWKPYAEEIKQMYGEGIRRNSIDMVAIHVRRGDYLRVPEFHMQLTDTDYYQRAIQEFDEHTNFLVFCKDNQGDDVDKADNEWCKEYFQKITLGRSYMHEHSTESEDLNTMASCKGLIMANSTFSWWAAYLGEQENIICPEKWFVDGKQRIDLIPQWKKI